MIGRSWPVSTVMTRGLLAWQSQTHVAAARRQNRRFTHSSANTARPTRRPVIARADNVFRKICS
jgi:hypothetical protein